MPVQLGAERWRVVGKSRVAEPEFFHIVDFRSALDARGYSLNTIQSYTTAVRQLYEFLLLRGFSGDIEQVAPGHLADFITSLEKRYARSTVNTRLAALRTFFDWLVDNSDANSSPDVTWQERKPDEAIARIDDSVRRIGDATAHELPESVGFALVKKALYLRDMGRHEEMVAVLGEVVRRFGQPTEPDRKSTRLNSSHRT